MKKDDELYVLMYIECPVCYGEGRIETMTWLTYSGDQTWKIEVCERCQGDRFSWERVKCPLCKDDILKVDESYLEGAVCHASCLAEALSPI